MLRRLSLVMAPLVAAAGIVVGVSGQADATPPALTGNVNCSFAGAGTLHPKLTAAGSAGGVKVTYDGKLFSCAGGSITISSTTYTVVGGSVKAAGYFTGVTASKCTNFEGAAPADRVGVIKMVVKWILSPPLAVAPSDVVYGTGGPYSAPVAGTTMALQLGTVPATPTTVTGSYAGSTSQDTEMNVSVPLGGCPVGVHFSFGSGFVKF